jgi:hypothetical protein
MSTDTDLDFFTCEFSYNSSDEDEKIILSNQLTPEKLVETVKIKIENVLKDHYLFDQEFDQLMNCEEFDQFILSVVDFG